MALVSKNNRMILWQVNRRERLDLLKPDIRDTLDGFTVNYFFIFFIFFTFFTFDNNFDFTEALLKVNHPNLTTYFEFTTFFEITTFLEYEKI
jgi:hypothetical protein